MVTLTKLSPIALAIGEARNLGSAGTRGTVVLAGGMPAHIAQTPDGLLSLQVAVPIPMVLHTRVKPIMDLASMRITDVRVMCEGETTIWAVRAEPLLEGAA